MTSFAKKLITEKFDQTLDISQRSNPLRYKKWSTSIADYDTNMFHFYSALILLTFWNNNNFETFRSNDTVLFNLNKYLNFICTVNVCRSTSNKMILQNQIVCKYIFSVIKLIGPCTYIFDKTFYKLFLCIYTQHIRRFSDVISQPGL